jgi:hypothetical protein
MTYGDLLANLVKMESQELNCDTTAYLSKTDEFFAVISCNVLETDVLDEGHPILIIEA